MLPIRSPIFDPIPKIAECILLSVAAVLADVDDEPEPVSFEAETIEIPRRDEAAVVIRADPSRLKKSARDRVICTAGYFAYISAQGLAILTVVSPTFQSGFIETEGGMRMI